MRIVKKSLPLCLFVLILYGVFFGAQLGYGLDRREVREDGLVGTFYHNAASKGQPPILLFGGSSGGNFFDKYQNYPEDLVTSGYAVLTLAYFDFEGKHGLPNKLRQIPLEYFKRAMDWLEKQPQIRKGEIAVVGNSRGGEAALLLATLYPEISTVVAIVPGAYVGGAYNNKQVVSGSAWTLNGQEIPYVDYQRAIANYSPWWKIIYDQNEVEPYAIPVEKMSAAVLLLSGTKDQIWPSTEMSRRIIQRLKKNSYSFPYTHISYDTGHNIRVESWPDVLHFLRNHYPVR